MATVNDETYGPNPYKWVLDPNVKRSGAKKGMVNAPDGYLRRCREKSITDKTIQCRYLAKKGFYYCRYHLAKSSKTIANPHRTKYRLIDMPRNKYTKHMSESLKNMIEDIRKDIDPLVMLDISQEIELLEVNHIEAIKIWDKARTSVRKDGTLIASVEQIAMAKDLMDQANEAVRKARLQQAEINAKMSEKLPLALIPHIIENVTNILREEVAQFFSDKEEVDPFVAKVCSRIESMRLPKSELAKNVSTAEMDAEKIRQFMLSSQLKEIEESNIPSIDISSAGRES
jgi:hypothetical protein